MTQKCLQRISTSKYAARQTDKRNRIREIEPQRKSWLSYGKIASVTELRLCEASQPPPLAIPCSRLLVGWGALCIYKEQIPSRLPCGCGACSQSTQGRRHGLVVYTGCQTAPPAPARASIGCARRSMTDGISMSHRPDICRTSDLEKAQRASNKAAAPVDGRHGQ